MPITEAILNQIKFCFSDDGHIAIEPIQVSCGDIGCKKCLIDSEEEEINCFSCNEDHKKSVALKGPINKVAESLVQTHLNDLFDYVETCIKKC
jgi:hypothetical protein